MNTFYNFFTYKDDMSYFSFFYFRTSPRGNSKLGLCDVPWQRLRMQQQGTDESIQFDYLWVLKTNTKFDVANFEKELKKHFIETCIFKETQRAGHTEWFKDLSFKDFKKQFYRIAEMYDIKFIEINNPKNPYTATRHSVCPLQIGISANQSWSTKYWKTNYSALSS